MNTLLSPGEIYFISSLGWILVHSVWQATLIAVAVQAILRLLRDRAPHFRYLVACGGLGAIAALPILTLLSCAIPSSPIPIDTAGSKVAAAADSSAIEEIPSVAPKPSATGQEAAKLAELPRDVPDTRGRARLELRAGIADGQHSRGPIGGSLAVVQAALPGIVILWFAGFLLRMVWLVTGCIGLSQLRHFANLPQVPGWDQRCETLRRVLGVQRIIDVFQSARISAPMVVGWWRPVIFIPASAITCLSPQELDTIILHELAHIRRYDHLVNLLQNLVETVLFFHPAVWWVSDRIRIEREYCCDDLVVSYCHDRLAYASALHRMESLSCGETTCAIAATAGALLPRVERIVEQRTDRARAVSYRLLAAIVAILSLTVVSIYLPLHWRGPFRHTSFLPSVDLSKNALDAARRPRPPGIPELTTSVVRGRQVLPQLNEGAVELILPSSGRIVFSSELYSARDERHFIIRPDAPGPIAVQVRSIQAVRPFLVMKWPDGQGGQTSDSDAGSGRGYDCFMVTGEGRPGLDNRVRCIISSQGDSSGRFQVCAWQPRVWQDCDPDVIGPESSLLTLDDYGHAQVPSRHNMRPPAIDFPDDIDTFQVWINTAGPVTFTVDGFNGGVDPYMRVYDCNRHLIASGPEDSPTRLHRLTVNPTSPQQQGYFLAVSNCDCLSTGEYTVAVYQQQ